MAVTWKGVNAPNLAGLTQAVTNAGTSAANAVKEGANNFNDDMKAKGDRDIAKIQKMAESEIMKNALTSANRGDFINTANALGSSVGMDSKAIQQLTQSGLASRDEASKLTNAQQADIVKSKQALTDKYNADVKTGTDEYNKAIKGYDFVSGEQRAKNAADGNYAIKRIGDYVNNLGLDPANGNEFINDFTKYAVENGYTQEELNYGLSNGNLNMDSKWWTSGLHDKTTQDNAANILENSRSELSKYREMVGFKSNNTSNNANLLNAFNSKMGGIEARKFQDSADNLKKYQAGK